MNAGAYTKVGVYTKSREGLVLLAELSALGDDTHAVVAIVSKVAGFQLVLINSQISRRMIALLRAF